MPREAQPRVLAAHAGAVVPHAHQAAAPLPQVDLDAPGAGIQRVLDQLLDRCGGPLHHLAGGDLVGERLGQHLDAGRHEQWQYPDRPGAVASLSSGIWPGWCRRCSLTARPAARSGSARSHTVSDGLWGT